MAELSYSTSVGQGFNFQKDEQHMVGHLVSCKIGDTELKADLNVTDPEDTASRVKVFGVMSGIYWNGGLAEAVQLACQVSNDNKVEIATLTHKSLSNTEVVMKFNVYDYDPDEKVYYKCFHTKDAELTGLIEKSGGDLNLGIDTDQSAEVMSPKNFAFSLSVMPEDIAQEIHVAVSSTGKFVKAWGVEVAS
jgi:hypothetical protein